MEDLGVGLQPVVHEGRLHLGDDRPFDAEVVVAPVVLVLGVAQPVVGDAHSAGEADPPVHHEELSVGAVVDAVQVVPAQRMVALDLRSRFLHALEELRVHPLAAEPVEEHVDLDPRARPLGQGLRKLPADLARPVDVGLEGDRLLSAADRREHRGEDLITVVEGIHLVAGDDGRPQEMPQGAAERRIFHSVERLDLAGDLALARRQIAQEDDDHESDGDRQEDRLDHRFSQPLLGSTVPCPRPDDDNLLPELSARSVPWRVIARELHLPLHRSARSHAREGGSR
jgi:hypothetical protein